MSAKKDLTGLRFHRLVATSCAGLHGREYAWECLCDCGKRVTVPIGRLRSGNTKSCGCLKAEILAKRSTTHGKSKNAAYPHWKGIFKRCKPDSKDAANYFDRGIGVDEAFQDFRVFLADIGEKPDDGQRWSVGRIDNNKGYAPGNVQWELDDEQARNHTKQRNNKTGVTGVSHRYKVIAGKTYESLIGAYVLPDGKKHQRNFSIDKFGYDGALQLAVKFREDGLKLLEEQGTVYAPSHGSEK